MGGDPQDLPYLFARGGAQNRGNTLIDGESGGACGAQLVFSGNYILGAEHQRPLPNGGLVEHCDPPFFLARVDALRPKNGP